MNCIVKVWILNIWMEDTDFCSVRNFMSVASYRIREYLIQDINRHTFSLLGITVDHESSIHCSNKKQYMETFSNSTAHIASWTSKQNKNGLVTSLFVRPLFTTDISCFWSKLLKWMLVNTRRLLDCTQSTLTSPDFITIPKKTQCLSPMI